MSSHSWSPVDTFHTISWLCLIKFSIWEGANAHKYIISIEHQTPPLCILTNTPTNMKLIAIPMVLIILNYQNTQSMLFSIIPWNPILVSTCTSIVVASSSGSLGGMTKRAWYLTARACTHTHTHTHITVAKHHNSPKLMDRGDIYKMGAGRSRASNKRWTLYMCNTE